jgi:hypothetical protein
MGWDLTDADYVGELMRIHARSDAPLAHVHKAESVIGSEGCPAARKAALEALEGAGRNVLPDLPGLLARVIGTEPRDPDTDVAFWVWETEDAANAWAWLTDPTLREQLETYMDVSGATVRGLDGMYFAHR